MIDTQHILKDAGVATDAVGHVDSSDVILDLGAGEVYGHLIVDVTGLEIADNDQIYKISLQGSSKSDFADTIEDLAILELGAAEMQGGIGLETRPLPGARFHEKNGTV